MSYLKRQTIFLILLCISVYAYICVLFYRGYVSINATNGALVWYDTLLTNPRVPVMNIQGDIIATDGNFLEIRLKNGSLIGKPLQFHGFLANASR